MIMATSAQNSVSRAALIGILVIFAISAGLAKGDLCWHCSRTKYFDDLHNQPRSNLADMLSQKASNCSKMSDGRLATWHCLNDLAKDAEMFSLIAGYGNGTIMYDLCIDMGLCLGFRRVKDPCPDCSYRIELAKRYVSHDTLKKIYDQGEINCQFEAVDSIKSDCFERNKWNMVNMTKMIYDTDTDWELEALCKELGQCPKDH